MFLNLAVWAVAVRKAEAMERGISLSAQALNVTGKAEDSDWEVNSKSITEKLARNKRQWQDT